MSGDELGVSVGVENEVVWGGVGVSVGVGNVVGWGAVGWGRVG